MKELIIVMNSYRSDKSELIQVFAPENNEKHLADVIFVHGLNGSPINTWMTNNIIENVKNTENVKGSELQTSWLYWLGKDTKVQVWSLGYPANASKWDGFTMPLNQRADNIINLLINNPKLNNPNLESNKPIIFVAHSMGGLVVKNIFKRIEGSYYTPKEKGEHLLKRIKGIVFLSTPHRGSDLANFVEYLTFLLPTESVKQLKKDNDDLLALNDWFHNNFYNLDLTAKVFYETQGTSIKKSGLFSRLFNKLVVTRDSANLNIQEVEVVGLDANHNSICWVNNPQKSRDNSQLYNNVVSFINEVIKDKSFFLNDSKEVSKIENLITEVRKCRYDKIQDLCGTMKMLDINVPVALANIYTEVNIFRELSKGQWKDRTELLKEARLYATQDFERIGYTNNITQERVPGLDLISDIINNPKIPNRLMIFGKPGSGKTTFLQWIAIKCNLGDFQPQLVPIFIRLKYFAKDTKNDNSESNKLFNYIKAECENCNNQDKSWIKTILTEGRALILLDGWDEVSEQDNEEEIIREIRKFVGEFFKNTFIITCRINDSKYRFGDEKFTYVEIADFNQNQIETFARNWFTATGEKNEENLTEQFIQNLNLPENKEIRELAITPILLNLTCFVFKKIRSFPQQRSKLYEEGLNILLTRWDKERKVDRDEVYKNLSVELKQELLTEVGAITFENNNYFFETEEIERLIANNLRNLSNKNNTQIDEATLKENSIVVLQSIEAQHGLLLERARGIYSFSHLTFQEYFTAKYLIKNLTPQRLQELVTGLQGGRWREVFLLVTPMLDNVIYLQQIKQNIDLFFQRDQRLQNFLKWVNEQANYLELNYKKSAIRAFYFSIVFDERYFNDFSLAIELDPTLKDHLSNSLTLYRNEDRQNEESFLLFDYVLAKIYHALNKNYTIKFQNYLVSNNLGLNEDFTSYLKQIESKINQLSYEMVNFERRQQAKLNLLARNIIIQGVQNKFIIKNDKFLQLINKIKERLLFEQSTVYNHSQFYSQLGELYIRLNNLDANDLNELIYKVLGPNDLVLVINRLKEIVIEIQNHNNQYRIEEIHLWDNYLREIIQISEEIQNQNNQYNLTKKSLRVELKSKIQIYRNIDFDWEFNQNQKEMLQKYYYANLWLAILTDNIINNSKKLQDEEKQQIIEKITEIQEALLLPID